MLAQPNIRYVTDIYFDNGAVQLLRPLLEKYQIKRPLVVTDKGLVNLGMIAALQLNDMCVFDNVETNPTQAMAEQGAERYLKNNCDGIIAYGGGSPIDLAKCIGLRVNHDF